MFKATREIYQELTRDGNLKVFTEDKGEQSYVWLQFGLKNGGSYRINFISKDDDNDVAVRVFGLITVEESSRLDMLQVINELNNKYRYAKFVCDNDGDINVEYDFPVQGAFPAVGALEIVLRFNKIIENAYPFLMKALWG